MSDDLTILRAASWESSQIRALYRDKSRCRLASEHPDDQLTGFRRSSGGSSASAFQRLRIWPVEKFSWLANMAIHRGLTYYYGRRARPLPRFSDFTEPDRSGRIARSLGLARKERDANG